MSEADEPVLQIRYTLRPEEVFEALRWRTPEMRAKLRRGLAGWMLFAGVLSAWIALVRSDLRMSGQQPPRTWGWEDVVLPAIPLLVVGGLLGFALLLQQWAYRRAWKKNPALQHPVILEPSENGLRATTILGECLHYWNGFAYWFETPELLVLQLVSGGRIAICRRAARNAAEWDEFCDAVRAHVSKPGEAKDERCRSCGYDLRASTDRCPECGTPIPG